MPINNNINNIIDENKINCKFCQKKFARIDIRTRHEKKCSDNDLVKQILDLKKNNNLLINENDKIKKI